MSKEPEYFLSIIKDYKQSTILTIEEEETLKSLDDFAFNKIVVQPRIDELMIKLKDPQFIAEQKSYYEDNEEWVKAEKKKIGLAKRREWLRKNYHKKSQ